MACFKENHIFKSPYAFVKSISIFVFFFLIAINSQSADVSLEGSILMSDSHESDFDADLQINYQIETYYEGSGSAKEYTGFTATFTGGTDGACNKLKLLFNQKLCAEASVKIKVPKSNSDGELQLFNDGEYTTTATSEQYATILNDTEILFDNNSCQGLKAGGCFYNTPEQTSTGECNPLSACQMCPGNTFTIEYICQNETTIPAEETVTVDPVTNVETTSYVFPVRKIFAIQEDSGLIIDSETFHSNATLPSITLTEVDAPILCENSNVAKDLVDETTKTQLNSVCGGDPNSPACKKEARKIMSLTFRKMAENRFGQAKSRFFFKHKNISESRAKRLRPPRQTLGFFLYRYNRQDGEELDLFDYKKTSSNKTSNVTSASNEEQRYKKTYTASCSSSCSKALNQFPTNHGGTYTSPVEIRNNCHRVFRGFNIGYRRCQTEEVVQPTIIQEREAEKTAAVSGDLNSCEQVKSASIDSIDGTGQTNSSSSTGSGVSGKYGTTTLYCSNPETYGYITSGCDTSGGNLSQDQCQVTCDPSLGYFPSGDISVSCQTDGNNFIFSGCEKYSSSESFTQASSDFYLSANYGVSTANGVVKKWYSKTNQNDQYALLTPSFGSVQFNPSNSNFNGHPTINVNGGGLKDSNFSGLTNSDSFTRIVVFSNDNVSTSNSVLLNSGSYGSIQRYSSTSLYSYTDSVVGARAQYGSFFSSSDISKPMVSVFRFDSSKGTNQDKILLKKNGEIVSSATYYSTLKTSSSQNGFSIGHPSATSVPWYGDVAEVIIFNRPLSDSEIEVIEQDLIAKYRTVELCTYPENTNNYNLSNCKMNRNGIKESECSISCADGYVTSQLSPINVSCESDGTFKFEGCYHPDDVPGYDFSEDFEYLLSDQKTINTNFTKDPNFISKWNVVGDQSYPTLVEHNGSTALKSVGTASHWYTGLATKSTWQRDITIDFDHDFETNYYNGTICEGMYLYEGTPTRNSTWTYPTGGNNWGRVCFWQRNGYSGSRIRLYMDGIFGASYVGLPSGSGRNFRVSVNIKQDSSYTVTVNYLDNPGLTPFTLNGNLTVQDLSNFTIEFGQGDYYGRYGYTDNIGIIQNQEKCTLAGVNTTGYNLTNCPTSSLFKSIKCGAISCDESNGYFSATGSPELICPSDGAKFQLNGCRSLGTMADYENEAIINFDSSQGIAHSSGKITSWTSVPNENGISYVATSNNSNYVTYKESNIDANNLPSVYVGGSGWLKNSNFTALNSLNQFTRIVVSKAVESGSYRGPVAFDNASGYQGWIDRQYTRLYGRSNLGNSYFYTSLNHEKVKPYETFISSSRFDNSGSTNGDKFEMRFNGEVIPTGDITYNSPPSTTSTGSYFNIGTYANGSYNYQGDIYKILYFDRKLKDAEITFIETELKKKYGLIKMCNAPSVASTIYDFSGCDTSGGAITSENCNVTCKGGYEKAVYYPIEATCEYSGGEFTASGCYLKGTAPQHLLFENFEYKTSSGELNSNFAADNEFTQKWDIHRDSGQGDIDLVDMNGSQMLRSYRTSGSHWGAGISTKMTFNPGIKIKYRHYVKSHYTNGTSQEGLFIYTGNRKSNSYYGYSDGSENAGNISTYMYGGARFYTGGIFGGGSSFSNLPTSTLPLVMDYEVDINTDLTWRVEINFPNQPSIAPVIKQGDLTVSSLKDFHLEFYSGDYYDRHSYFDNIEVINTAFSCTLAGVDTNGYDVSSCPSTGNFSGNACSVICDSTKGFIPEPRAEMSCSADGQKYVLSGCKNYGTINGALSNNVLHLEANDITSVDANNRINAWASKASASGVVYNVARKSTSGPLLKTVDGQKLLEFSGSATEALGETQFNGLDNQEKFTRVVVFKPNTNSFMAIYDASSGYDVHAASGYYYLQSSAGSIYARGSFTNNLLGDMQVAITEFDDSISDNTQKIKLRINGENKLLDYFRGSMIKPITGSPGINIGNWTSGYNFNGDIAEVIYFKNILPEQTRSALETQLMKKYGVLKSCTLPGSTLGYDTSGCDTSSGSLASAECNLSCSSGYASHELLSPRAVCKSSEGKFELSGCYDLSDYPSNSEIAEQLIKENNVLHLDADSVTTVDANNRAETWMSKENKDGKTTELTRASSLGPIKTTHNNSTFFEFNGNYRERLLSNSFKGLVNKNSFTRMMVYRPHVASNNILLYDEASGYDAYYHSSYIYTHSNKASNDYARFTGASNFLNKTLVQTTMLDNTKHDVYSRYKTVINDQQIEYSYFKTSKMRSPGSGVGMALGGYNSNSYPFDGLVGEVIFFDRALSHKENRFLTTYLNKKYNLVNTCTTPSTSKRYDMSACNTSKEQLTSSECSLSCNVGFTQLGKQKPWADCSTDGGNFNFSGCFSADEINTTNKISSCRYAPSSGIYLIDSVKESGELQSNVKVYCDVVDGEGAIDLVKTLGISGSENFVKGFFVSNNSSDIEVSQEINDDGTVGVLVQNLGNKSSSVSLTEGFHITQANHRYTSVNLSYNMQGSKSSNSCDSSGLAPLSGPGTLGTYSAYYSPCLAGKTCLQDKPRNKDEAPVNATYLNPNLNETDVLSFSGSGRAGTSGDVVCVQDPVIPSSRPSTFITKLNVVNAKEKLCKIPSSTPGFDLNCGTPSLDGHYAKSSCSLSCSSGYTTSELVPMSFNCEEGGREFSLYGCFDSSGPSNDDLAKNIIRTKNILHYDANYGVTLDSSNEAVSWESRVNKNGEVVTITAASNGPVLVTENGNPFLSWQSGSNSKLSESNFQPFYGTTNFTRIIAHEPRFSNWRGHYGMIETNDAGYDGYHRDYNRYQIQSNKGSSGLAVVYDQTLNSQLNENFFVQVTNFDNLQGRYGAMELKFNDEDYRYAQYSSENIGTPTNGKGVTIGRGAGYGYQGLMGDVIFFNEKLSDQEVDLITNYLAKKYGQAKTCTLPSNVDGYNVNSCLTGSTELDCSITCDTGYESIAEVDVSVSCSEVTGEFTFNGCFPSSKLPTPKELDPTLAACTLPSSIPSGYVTTNCNTTGGHLTEQECDLTCDTGYKSIGSSIPYATCLSDGGEFSFEGCYLEASIATATPATSCAVVPSSGLYQISTVEGQASNTSNQVVYCEVDGNGNGFIDLVKTAYHSTGLNFIKTIFSSNNSSSLNIELAKNINNTPGLLIQNLGEYSSPNTYKEGFHLTQDKIIFNSVVTDWLMQGGTHYNVCPIANYAIPLNGPGYDGAQNNYLSPCPSGKTCIQGKPLSGSDSSISASYINASLLSTEVLTWNGAGRASFDADIVHSCSKNKNIPSTRPSTFITKLLVGDTLTKLCKKPDIRSDYAAFDISCSPSVDGYNKVNECSVSCAAGYTQFTQLELYCDETKSDFRFIGCGLTGVAQTTENTENGKFAIQYNDYTKYFESSFSNYSLPDPQNLLNGWYVTVKAKDGPVIIYPSQDKSVTSTTPLFNSTEHHLVLTEKDGFAKIVFENGHWKVDSGNKISYSKFKNDKPQNCPDGMTGVPGSYLLETQGFCVEKNHSALNRTGTYDNVINEYNNTVCSLIPYQAGVDGGTAKVLTFKHYQTMHNYALKNNTTNGVLSLSSTDYANQWPNIRKKACSWNSSYGCSHSGGVTGTNNGFNIGDGSIFKHHVSYQSSSCTRNRPCQNRSTIYNYMEILDYESNDNRNLCYDILGYSSGLGFNSKASILNNNSTGVEESIFDNDALNSVYDIDRLCKSSNFDIFTGVKSNFALPNPYSNFNYQFENDVTLAGHVSIPGGKLQFSNRSTNVPSANQIRCMYLPGEFSCELPSVTTGYVTTGCDASSTNKLKPTQCNISCASGYSAIPDFGPSASCLPAIGNQEGTFKLRGCYADEDFSSPTAISSCNNATKEGIYLIDMVGHDGKVTEDVKVFCEIDPQGNKSINVIKTMKIAEMDGTSSVMAPLFFEPNNSSSLVITVEENANNETGLLIRNLGENIVEDTDFKSGFHITKSAQVYDTASMNYFMQGSRELDSCNSNYWIALNGPGYNGGYSTHVSSPSLPGFTSIQGSASLGRDASISASYKNQSILPTEILTFSGSGKDNNIVYSCMESSSIPRISGVPKASTFFTSLKLNDSTTKHCSKPSLSNGLILNCGSTNSDGLYSLEQCNLECDSGLYLYQSKLNCEEDLKEFSAEGFCVSQSELDTALDLEVLEPFSDPTNYQQVWSLSLTGSADQFTPVPYTGDANFSSAFACRTTSVYPNDTGGSCTLETSDFIVDGPTLHPVNIDFIVKNLTASHTGHANFYYEIIDSDGVVSQMRWQNYGDYMYYVSGTEMFSGISAFHSPSARAYRGMPMKFTTKMYKNGEVHIAIESHDGGQKKTALADWSNYRPPFKVKVMFTQRDFWGANNINIIDELNIYKSIDNDQLIGPF